MIEHHEIPGVIYKLNSLIFIWTILNMSEEWELTSVLLNIYT